MIILNQKKNIIINFSNVVSIYVQEKNVQVLMSFIEDALILGKYATEERAKEVKEDIIDKYEDIQILKYSRESFTTRDNFVYRMPKE